MKENRTEVVMNEPMGERAFRLRFEVDWKEYDPGQFVMVRVPGGEVFLRRPFGIADLSHGCAEICCKVVGKGTSALSKVAPGTAIDVLGPCGKGFSLPEGKAPVLVAGGYGIGPMMGFVRRAKAALYYGAKREGDLLYRDELKSLKGDVVIATEDGSSGEKGLITGMVERDIDGIEGAALFACGPRGLLEAVAKLGISRGIPTQVSTDEYMACGIGVCMGCVVDLADGGRARTCRDGPVFDAKELKWEEKIHNSKS